MTLLLKIQAELENMHHLSNQLSFVYAPTSQLSGTDVTSQCDGTGPLGREGPRLRGPHTPAAEPN